MMSQLSAPLVMSQLLPVLGFQKQFDLDFKKTVFITFSKTIGFLAQTSDFSHEKPFVVHNHRIN